MKVSSLRPVTRRNMITYAIIILTYTVVQILSATGKLSYLIAGLLIKLCVYVILAVSLNLTVGVLGELSLGHAGFTCVGAYAGSMFAVVTQDTLSSVWIRFPLALLIGGIAAAVFGILIGLPVLRLRGDYLAIVTLAFGEIIRMVAGVFYLGKDSNGLHAAFIHSSSLQLEPDGEMIAKGTQGVLSIPMDSSFTVGIILVLITLLVITNMMDSRAGRAVMSIRDNRIAAESVGVNITKYKLLAFSVSAFFAGIAGVLYSHDQGSVTPSTFDYNKSIEILVMVVLGGMGSIRGSVIAAVLLTALPEILRFLQDYRMLIYSVILILAMILSNNEKVKALVKKVMDRIKKRIKNWVKHFKKPAGEGAK